ncbi:hypothetical protein DICVIV_01506 [Dictyocaulus viviparus]|uniref:Uncharacterized protein n=1 Tax=Dictyocaulus viviparus TaxID=29172 RepID=A0A0D8Y8K3_DICVI|nr:hypothetical protein DICVIV_01506 [Dictyocaulus viviparus]
MEIKSVEHGLAQKLMIMENAVARVATIRAQLRTNTDQARKEIRSVMSQQMLLLRAREQELLDELDVITNYRERGLEHQQQLLYRSIWECKQAQKKLNENADSNSDAAEVFSRLCHVETTVQDWAHVSFESDAIGLRSSLLSFGNIRTIPDRDNARKCSLGESLPVEVEEDDAVMAHNSVLRIEEDDAVMAHKSVLRIGSSPANPYNMTKQQVESVRKWLKKIPSGSSMLGTDMSSIMNEFEVIKSTALSDSESSDSTLSFDPIAKDSTESCISTKMNEILSAEFLNTLRQPLSSWLIRAKQKEQEKVTSDIFIILLYHFYCCSLPNKSFVFQSSDMKRLHSFEDEKRYGFEDVIRKIQLSNNEDWMLGSRPKELCAPVTSSNEQSPTNEQECDVRATTTSSTQDMLDFALKKLYGCHIKSAPQPSMKGRTCGQEIDLSTVIGWKRILERIDQSTSFWLQDKKP